MDVSGDEDVRDILFVVRGLTPEDLAAEPRIAVVRDLGGGASLVGRRVTRCSPTLRLRSAARAV